MLWFCHWLADKIAQRISVIARVHGQEPFPQCFEDCLNPEQLM